MVQIKDFFKTICIIVHVVRADVGLWCFPAAEIVQRFYHNMLIIVPVVIHKPVFVLIKTWYII